MNIFEVCQFKTNHLFPESDEFSEWKHILKVEPDDCAVLLMCGYGGQVVRKLPQSKNRISTKIYEGRLLFETVWNKTGLHLLECRVLRGVQNLGLSLIHESVNITALQACLSYQVQSGTGKPSDISYYPFWIVLSVVHDRADSVLVRPSAENFAPCLPAS